MLLLCLLLLLDNDSDMNGKDIELKIYIGDTVSCCSLFVLPIACQSRVSAAAADGYERVAVQRHARLRHANRRKLVVSFDFCFFLLYCSSVCVVLADTARFVCLVKLVEKVPLTSCW